MMTTITREDWDTLQRIAGRIGGRFVLNDGITIADPEPPEAMVKLARGQVVAKAERERCAKLAEMKAEAITELVANDGRATEARAAAQLALEGIAAAILALPNGGDDGR